MTDTEIGRESPSAVGRLRERLRSVEPTTLGLLGLLSLPARFVDELAVLDLFGLFFLFFLWPLVAPVVGAVRSRVGDGETAPGPRDWLKMGGWREYALFLLSMPLTVLNPLTFTQDVLQFVGGGVALVRHRGSLPGPETHESAVRYRPPVEGSWTVVNGSPIEEHSHSWLPVTQRYAYDFVLTDEDGRTRPEGTGTRLENYYCYDEPVRAPADGVVVEVCDSDVESPWAGGLSHPLKRTITGNYVVLRHAEEEYSTLAHLVPGSVAVAAGERVDRGQVLARCGHSGNSSEPHLHFQVQDHPTFELAAGLPVAFSGVTVDCPGENVAADWDAPDAAGQYVHVGQRFTYEPDAPAEYDRDPASARDRDRSPGHPVALGRTGFGLVVGGVLVGASGVVTASPRAVTATVLAAAVLGAGYRFALLALRPVRPRTGGLGLPLGLALVAALVTGASHSPTPGETLWGVALLAALCGFLLTVVAGEYGRRGLRANVADGQPR